MYKWQDKNLAPATMRGAMYAAWFGERRKDLIIISIEDKSLLDGGGIREEDTLYQERTVLITRAIRSRASGQYLQSLQSPLHHLTSSFSTTWSDRSDIDQRRPRDDWTWCTTRFIFMWSEPRKKQISLHSHILTLSSIPSTTTIPYHHWVIFGVPVFACLLLFASLSTPWAVY